MVAAGAWNAVAVRAAGVAGVGVFATTLGALTPWRPATLCMLRAATGVPCPFCGTTTAVVRVAAGDLAGAVAANPVTTLGAAGLVLAPLFLHRVPRSWHAPVFTAAAALAWVWQLTRFGYLPV